ncbi:hypothetical protein Drorol1_Dr00018410 [Drosera rotundifolia]
MNAHVRFLEPGVSDHSPACVSIEKVSQYRTSFKYLNVWGLHPLFLQLVGETLKQHVSGSHMYSVVQKMKRLKGPLKKVHKEYFSGTSGNINQAEQELEGLQMSLLEFRNCSQGKGVSKVTP